MDLALNNLQRLICHKTQQTKPITSFIVYLLFNFYLIFTILLFIIYQFILILAFSHKK